MPQTRWPTLIDKVSWRGESNPARKSQGQNPDPAAKSAVINSLRSKHGILACTWAREESLPPSMMPPRFILLSSISRRQLALRPSGGNRPLAPEPEIDMGATTIDHLEGRIIKKDEAIAAVTEELRHKQHSGGLKRAADSP